MRGCLLGVLVILLVGAPAARVEAVTVREIVELVRAGVSDEVLVALIEADRTVFALTADQILELRAAGVSDRVLVAMLRSGRLPELPVEPSARTRVAEAAGSPAVPTGPAVHLIVDRHERCPHMPGAAFVVAPVAVPIVIAPVPHARVGRPGDLVEGAPLTGFGALRPRLTGFGSGATFVDPPAPAPVYWGWGGRLRPDAWGQPARATETSSGRSAPPR